MKNQSTNELPFQRAMIAAERPQKKQMTRTATAPSEDADGPDDRDDREHYGDRPEDGADDPDDDLEQDPARDQQDQDRDGALAEVSSRFAHVLSLAEDYRTKGGLVGTYRSSPGSGTEHMTQLGQ